jgi:hypothetical protein
VLLSTTLEFDPFAALGFYDTESFSTRRRHARRRAGRLVLTGAGPEMAGLTMTDEEKRALAESA